MSSRFGAVVGVLSSLAVAVFISNIIGLFPDLDKSNRLDVALSSQYKPAFLAGKEIQVSKGGDSYLRCDGDSIYMTNNTIKFGYSISFNEDLSTEIFAPGEHGQDFSISLVTDLRNAMLGSKKVCEFNRLVSMSLRDSPVMLPLSAGHKSESGSDGALKWSIAVGDDGYVQDVSLHIDSLKNEMDAQSMVERFVRKMMSISSEQLSAR